MNIFKKIILSVFVIMALGVTGVTAFGKSEYINSDEVTVRLSGKTIDNIRNEEKNKVKTYGLTAKKNMNLYGFKKENLEIRKDILEAQALEGRISKEDADSIIKLIQERQLYCNEEGFFELGEKEDFKFGFHRNNEERVNRRSASIENKNNLRMAYGANRSDMRNNNSNYSSRGLRLGVNSCMNPIK